MKTAKHQRPIITGMLILLCAIFSCAPTLADSFAATLTKLDGKAYAAATGGVTRKLAVTDHLFEKERVITGKDTSAELTFTDDTSLILGASTIVTVDSYRYQKIDRSESPTAQKEESFSMSILQGAVRAVTGLLAKRRPLSVRFKTRVATIGIRGTHFAAEVEGDSATIILLAQEDTKASNAIEVSNSYGKVEIDKPGWGTEVPDASSPPSPPRLMQHTQGMNRVLRSVNTTRRVRVPRSPIR